MRLAGSLVSFTLLSLTACAPALSDAPYTEPTLSHLQVENVRCGVRLSAVYHDEDGDLDEAELEARFDELTFVVVLEAFDTADAWVAMEVPLASDPHGDYPSQYHYSGVLPGKEYDVELEIVDRHGGRSNTLRYEGYETGVGDGC